MRRILGLRLTLSHLAARKHVTFNPLSLMSVFWEAKLICARFLRKLPFFSDLHHKISRSSSRSSIFLLVWWMQWTLTLPILLVLWSRVMLEFQRLRTHWPLTFRLLQLRLGSPMLSFPLSPVGPLLPSSGNPTWQLPGRYGPSCHGHSSSGLPSGCP